jgi:hypothetical protein
VPAIHSGLPLDVWADAQRAAFEAKGIAGHGVIHAQGYLI